MGITLSGLGGWLAPLHGLVGWLTGAAPRSPGAMRTRPELAKAGRACSSWATLGPRITPHITPRAHRPLRVVRVVEASQAARSAGRMVISGRMADVCAELDRLAAQEATAG
ncbi:MAG TPA: hypothetical protein VLI46_10310 [Ramlibacter sp.]|nr:hypothetical protein [Ramlibacter sp.]